MKNAADAAEVFLEFSFFWQKCQTYQNWNILGNVLTKRPTDLRVIPMKILFVADHLLSPLSNGQHSRHSRKSRNEELSSKQLQSQGFIFLGSPWSILCFLEQSWKIFLHCEQRWEYNSGSSHSQPNFLLFELNAECLGQQPLDAP